MILLAPFCAELSTRR